MSESENNENDVKEELTEDSIEEKKTEEELSEDIEEEEEDNIPSEEETQSTFEDMWAMLEPSVIDELLVREGGVELIELMIQDEFIQEIRTGNIKLISVLSEKDVMKELISLFFVDDSLLEEIKNEEDREIYLFKLPYMVRETIKCNNDEIIESFFKNPEVHDQVFDFFFNYKDDWKINKINPAILDYYITLMHFLFRLHYSKSIEIMTKKVQEIKDINDFCFNLMKAEDFHELFRIMLFLLNNIEIYREKSRYNLEDQEEKEKFLEIGKERMERRSIFVKELVSKKFIPKLIEKIKDNSDSPDYLYNAFNILKVILNSEKFVKELFSDMYDNIPNLAKVILNTEKKEGEINHLLTLGLPLLSNILEVCVPKEECEDFLFKFFSQNLNFNKIIKEDTNCFQVHYIDYFEFLRRFIRTMNTEYCTKFLSEEKETLNRTFQLNGHQNSMLHIKIYLLFREIFNKYEGKKEILEKLIKDIEMFKQLSTLMENNYHFHGQYYLYLIELKSMGFLDGEERETEKKLLEEYQNKIHTILGDNDYLKKIHEM